MKFFKIVGKTQLLIRDTGPAQPLIDPAYVAEILEADQSTSIGEGANPASLAMVGSRRRVPA